MRVYHASDVSVERPDVSHSRNYLDFGKGFYVTTLRGQAQRYALRFVLRGRAAYLNEYDLNDGLYTGFPKKEFPSYDEEWLDFVSACRKGLDESPWEIVAGGVADDRVFRTIDLYFSGDITKGDALGRLKYERPNNQICLRSQRAIDELLTFVRSTEVL